jgi:putative ubiquitin-RnfH superfamily antitoxin RatB of RatAB toxin-antitoxin module
VAYALPQRQCLLDIAVPVGTCAREALRLSQINKQFPEIDIENCPLGVFGREVAAEFVLRDGDRVEIYRPLLKDPREQRRSLARSGRNMGQSES